MRLVLLMMAVLGVVVSSVGCGQPAGQPPAGEAQPAPEPVPPEGPREEVPNPQYQGWAKFPPGTVAVQKTITETEGNEAKTVTTVTYRLLEVTPDDLELESQASTRRYDGFEANNPPGTYRVPRLLRLPAGMKKEDVGKPRGVTEQGEATLTVGGKTYHTRWYKGTDRNEAGEVFTQTWVSDEVPGGLVKSVVRTPGVKKVSTIELVEVKTP